MREEEQAQRELEKRVNKYNLLPFIREYFVSVGAKEEIARAFISENFGINLLAKMAVHKRLEIPAAIGMLEYYCSSVQDAANQLERAIKNNLVGFDLEKGHLVVARNIPDEIQEQINVFQFPIPMMIKPKEVKKNSDTGYYTVRNSIILKNNHHNEDVCLDHINRINSIPLSINEKVAKSSSNRWKNIYKGESWEIPRKMKAFNKYNKYATVVIDLFISMGNKFYLTNKYDKRGRTYSVGYYINPQGTDYNKACIEFYEKELVNG